MGDYVLAALLCAGVALMCSSLNGLRRLADGDGLEGFVEDTALSLIVWGPAMTGVYIFGAVYWL